MTPVRAVLFVMLVAASVESQVPEPQRDGTRLNYLKRLAG